MGVGRPRSIVRLILYGFAAVTMPLLAAVITAVVQVDNLAARSQRAVFDAEVATQESRTLVQNLTEMERSLGQFQVLGDRDFYSSYLTRRAAFKDAAERLATLDLGENRSQRIQDLVATEASLNRQLLTPAGELSAAPDTKQIAAQWARLSGQVQEVLTESSALISIEADNARDAAQALQRTLLLQATAVIPVTLLIAIVFVFLITRPLRAISEHIRRLGSGDFAAPVTIEGPHDLVDVASRLDWLRRRILELEEQKTRFLRHISHELKTPLTSIREGAELLMGDERNALGREQKEIVQIMLENSQHLHGLIEDLLRFGKALGPNVGVVAGPRVKLDELVRAAIESHGVGRTAKNLRLTAELESVSLAGDADQLRTVMDNLLSNAIKHSPPGGQLDVSLSARNAVAILEVTDSGSDAGAEERQQGFEPSYQGRAPYTGYVPGTGLGLAIARQYVEANHGQIEMVESRFGRGVCVRVRFPIAFDE